MVQCDQLGVLAFKNDLFRLAFGCKLRLGYRAAVRGFVCGFSCDSSDAVSPAVVSLFSTSASVLLSTLTGF
jgi:hypothetical protein